jgi:integrase
MARKNSNGSGSIYKDASSGRWVGAITIGTDDTGRPVRRKVTARTQQEARDRLDSLRRSVAVGDALPAEMTVAQFLEHWRTDVLPLADVSPVTRTGYARIVKLYIVPTIGRVRLDELEPHHVRKMLTKLRDQGLSPNTMRQARSVLRRALRTAEVDGLVTRNVARLVDGVKVGRPEGRTLTPEQARKLLREAQGHEVGALVTVLLMLGIRKGEALGLGWRELDLDATRPTLTIARSLKKSEDGSVYLDEPKTAGSRRTLHIPAPVVDVLRAHRLDQKRGRLAFGKGWGGPWLGYELVFTSSVGSPLDPDRVNRQVKKLTAELLGDEWTPHEMRHSAASIMLGVGVPLKTVSETLGHSSIRVTADVYGHLLEPARAEAAEAMTAALFG